MVRQEGTPMRPVGTAAELERRRLRAVQLLQQGEKIAVIVRILGLHKSTLYRWKEAFDQGGSAALAARSTTRPPGLANEQLAQLAGELQKGAAAHGWVNDLWTGERVRAVIQRLFGVTYTADHVRRLLRQRMRWTSQKPERRGRERDEAEIERWRTEEFPGIKKRPTTSRPSRVR
jgi:Transposase and inactivated derivatives